jgi:hypothetical protein
LEDFCAAANCRLADRSDPYSINFLMSELLKGLPEIDSDVLELLATTSSLKLMDSSVIARSLEDFRVEGSPLQQYRLKHRSCRSGFKKSQVQFLNFNDLISIEHNYFPLLSKSEWSNMRSGFFEHIKTGTHSHSFFRSSKYYLIVDPESVAEDGAGSNQGALFEALMLNEPALLKPVSTSQTTLKRKNILKRLADKFDFEEGVNCADGVHCDIGKLKANSELESLLSIHLEIASNIDSGNVTWLRLQVPMNLIVEQDLSTPSELLRAQQAYYAGQILSQALVVSILDEPLGFDAPSPWGAPEKGPITDAEQKRHQKWMDARETPAQSYLSFRSEVAQCGSAQFKLESKFGEIDFYTVTPSKWLSLEITPNEQQ